MQFTQITLSVNDTPVIFTPYDRGASGSFVYRKSGETLQAPRLIVSTQVDDNASDKYAVQVNTPRVQSDGDSDVTNDVILGTDLVKTELRFLATTSTALRKHQIDEHIAALQEFRSTIENREKLYS